MINEVIAYLTIIFGIAMSISWFFQAKTMYKNRSAQNVSMIFIVVAWFAILFYTIQRIITDDHVIYIPFSIGFIGITTVLILYLKYRK